MTATFSTLSVEYVRVPVGAKEDGVAVDPTGDTVQMSFTKAVTTAPTVWNAASWETDATVSPIKHYARCVLGPGNVVLTVGRWVVWVKLTDNPEVPVLPSGEIVIV